MKQGPYQNNYIYRNSKKEAPKEQNMIVGYISPEK